MDATHKSHHVLGLDIIRFMAAMGVVFVHMDYGLNVIPLSWTGWVGVEVFFVISGFVIAYSAEGRSVRAFAKSRIVRLMPGVWIFGSVTALFVLYARMYPDLPVRYLNTLVLWPWGPWVDGAYWTLPVEVAFYTMVMFTLFHRKWFTLSGLLQSMSLMSGVFWFMQGLRQVKPDLPFLGPILESLPRDFVFFVLNYGGHFSFGGLLWMCTRTGFTRWRLCLLAISLAAGAVQLVFASTTVTGLARLVPIPIWFVLVMAVVASVLGNAWVWRVFGRYARAIRLIGLTTYPLYLLHDDIAIVMMDHWKVPLFPAMAIIVFFSFIAAAYIEPPAQKWLRSRLWAS